VLADRCASVETLLGPLVVVSDPELTVVADADVNTKGFVPDILLLVRANSVLENIVAKLDLVALRSSVRDILFGRGVISCGNNLDYLHGCSNPEPGYLAIRIITTGYRIARRRR
jgi:hypothetical protein